LFRLNGDDLLPGGIRVEDSKEIAKLRKDQAFVVLMSLPGCTNSKDMEYFQAFIVLGVPWRYGSPLRQGSETVAIPVIAGGRINEPLAEEILQKVKLTSLP
jgi:2,4-dienoyl-CoA reductase-like NADH-dependent reductase (Old Yellow Enzyme family)